MWPTSCPTLTLFFHVHRKIALLLRSSCHTPFRRSISLFRLLEKWTVFRPAIKMTSGGSGSGDGGLRGSGGGSESTMTIYWLGVFTLFLWISVMLCLTREYWRCCGVNRDRKISTVISLPPPPKPLVSAKFFNRPSSLGFSSAALWCNERGQRGDISAQN